MTTAAAEALYLAQHLAEHNGGAAVFNPQGKPVEQLSVIMAFSNVGGGDGVAYAMHEDGTVLGSHWCSHEGYVSHDLGVTEGSRPDRHETYQKHSPDGYRMEFVPACEVKTHPTLRLALHRNQERHAAASPPTAGEKP